MMLERVICAGWGLCASVLALIAGQQAVASVAACAGRWAAHIEQFITWSN